jgi:hypothetical protein
MRRTVYARRTTCADCTPLPELVATVHTDREAAILTARAKPSVDERLARLAAKRAAREDGTP